MPEVLNSRKSSGKSLEDTEPFLLQRLLPFPATYVRLALHDLVERYQGQVQRVAATSSLAAVERIESELLVFDRVSRFAITLYALDKTCRVDFLLLTAAQDLSAQGRKRSLCCLADTLEQLIENSLSELRQDSK